MDVSELAQKLYEDDGFSGNLYKASYNACRKYEQQAMEILGEDAAE